MATRLTREDLRAKAQGAGPGENNPVARAARIITIAFAACACVIPAAHAQTFPTKSVRLVVPFTPGSNIDILARPLAQKLSEIWSQPVVVENRPGAGGTLGANVVAKSQPDGYTMLINSSAQSINPSMYANLPYKQKDFVEVAALVSQPYVVVVGPESGLKSLSDLLALAKSKPGQINFGSAGTGSGTHFAAERFRLAANIDVVHVPYKGGAEANTDTMAGRITYWFGPVGVVLPHVQSGRLVALAVSSPQRSVLLPNVPTIAESGLPGFADSIWFGLWTRAGTPAAVVGKLRSDVSQALAASDLRDRFAKLGTEPMNMTAAEFARFVSSETEAAARVTRAVGIKAQ
jgi:tripartite-type tricarboxylate transporter receptor subunit TctC